MKGTQSEGSPRQDLRRAGGQNRVPSGETRVTPKLTRDVKTPDPIFHLQERPDLLVLLTGTTRRIQIYTI